MLHMMNEAGVGKNVNKGKGWIQNKSPCSCSNYIFLNLKL